MATEIRTLGFWKHGARLVSAWIRNRDVPKSSRLILVQNSKKRSGDKYPDMIGYFANAQDEDAKDIPHPYTLLSSQARESEELIEKAEELLRAAEQLYVYYPDHGEDAMDVYNSAEREFNSIRNKIREFVEWVKEETE